MSTQPLPIGLPRPRFLAKPKPAWKGVLAAADAAEQKFIVAILSAARVGRQSVDVEGIAHALASHDYKGVDDLLSRAVAEATRMIELRLPRLILDTMAAGGEAAAKSVRASGSFRAAKKGPLGELHFDLVNPEALKWARTKAGAMVRGINAETQNAIRRAISRSFAEGIPTRQVAVILRESIGLDPRRMDAVLNLRKRLESSPGGLVYAGKTPIRVPAAGASKAFLEVKTKAYAQRLLNQRAESIARTEAISASNEGQRQLWLQAVQKDLLFADELREWIVTGDKRLCPQCEAAAGDLAPLGKPFPNGSMGPPLHPMCRCTTGISGKRGKKAYADPQKALDKLLAPAAGDSIFPGAGRSGDVEAAARKALSSFDARVKALGKDGIKLELKDWGETEAGIRKRYIYDLDPATALGRKRIFAMDTALDTVGSAMQRLRAAGAILPEDKMIMGFVENGATEYAHATAKGKLYVNMDHPAWQSAEAIRAAMLRNGEISWLSTGEADGIFVHEMGHVTHSRRAKDVINAFRGGVGRAGSELTWNVHVTESWAGRDWNQASKVVAHWQTPDRFMLRGVMNQPPSVREDAMRKIASKVSRYAAENSAEFVAETYTGLVYGKKYDDEVMALYRALGGPEVKGAAKAVVQQVTKTVVTKGDDFAMEGVWDVVLPSGHKTGIFYDKASQTWYENVRDGDVLSGHYSKLWGHSKDELLQKLETHYAKTALPVPGPKPLPQPLPKPLPKPLPEPLPKPEKVFKDIRPVPEGEAGDLIRKVQSLRAEGLDYTAIARKMGWDVTPRGIHRGPGPGPVKVSSILKRFGDPLERIAPRPL